MSRALNLACVVLSFLSLLISSLPHACAAFETQGNAISTRSATRAQGRTHPPLLLARECGSRPRFTLSSSRRKRENGDCRPWPTLIDPPTPLLPTLGSSCAACDLSRGGGGGKPTSSGGGERLAERKKQEEAAAAGTLSEEKQFPPGLLVSKLFLFASLSSTPPPLACPPPPSFRVHSLAAKNTRAPQTGRKGITRLLPPQQQNHQRIPKQNRSRAGPPEASAFP